MLKYTKHTLQKMEDLLQEIGYEVRTGKGSFSTGYCILESKKVVVINRYHSTEARILSLIEILRQIEVDVEELEDKSKIYYKQLVEE
ncbi:MAG: hypothetical protein R3E32_10000 [Chitinophagales bacterium]